MLRNEHYDLSTGRVSNTLRLVEVIYKPFQSLSHILQLNVFLMPRNLLHFSVNPHVFSHIILLFSINAEARNRLLKLLTVNFNRILLLFVAQD